jgi:putative ABC transport system permease protein
MQNLGDTFGQVLRAIWANKLRSFLTMFGIAWGVGSMLLLISVGEGFRSGQHRELASVGNDVIMMWGGNIPAVPSQHTGMRPYNLTVGDEAAMRASGSFREVMGLIRRSDIKQQSQYQTAGGGVLGTEPNYPTVRFLPMATGRFLSDEDLRERRRVVVLGQKSASLLFRGHPALGERILLNGTSFQVIGVAAKTGHGDDDGWNQQLYVPLTTMLEMFPIKGENIPLDALSSIQYQPMVRDESEQAKSAARAIVAERHNFDGNDPDAFEEWDTIKSGKLVGKIFTAMDVFLGGVGIVTLALGAVGIVNIMLVSVSERTKEIGLRKAIGATKRSILMQFFLEGLFLTGVSGLIGIGGSALLMYLIQTAIGGQGVDGFDPPRLVPWSAALALISLSFAGIFAGLYPASKAAALEPVEALRRE